MKLKHILDANFGQPKKPSLDEKASFIEEVKRFNEYGSVVYRTEDLKKVAEAITALTQRAEQITLQETEDWFDEVTVKRNMREMKQNVKEFNKSVSEISKLQQRLESVYEEIGHKLSRYYEL